jgi:hypothetical protein
VQWDNFTVEAEGMNKVFSMFRGRKGVETGCSRLSSTTLTFVDMGYHVHVCVLLERLQVFGFDLENNKLRLASLTSQSYSLGTREVRSMESR